MVLLALRGIPLAAGAQVEPSRIEQGSTEERLEALVKILKVAPDQRETATWQVLEREARRMLEVRRGLRPGSEEDVEIIMAYSAGLIGALAQWRNPKLIPLLIEYSSGYSYAWEGLYRFGDIAVPALINAIVGADDSGVVASSTVILGRILREPAGGQITPLTAAHHQQIVALAEELLGPRFTLGNIVGITDLALATGRADLRQDLERLAVDSLAWSERGVSEAASIELGQRILKGQLKRFQTGATQP